MGISLWQLLIILVIVLLLFGTKKLRNIGSDLGGAIKGFRDSMDKPEEAQVDEKKLSHEDSDEPTSRVIEGETNKQRDSEKV